MNERLKERIADEWAQLDPVDPLRRLLSDVIDVLAQPAQEPDDMTIAYMSGLYDGKKKRPWVGLTYEEVGALWDGWKDAVCLDHKTWARAIEAKLKEKNT